MNTPLTSNPVKYGTPLRYVRTYDGMEVAEFGPWVSHEAHAREVAELRATILKLESHLVDVYNAQEGKQGETSATCAPLCKHDWVGDNDCPYCALDDARARIVQLESADHCDFPDCEQHWTYVVDLALAAMAKFHATFAPDEEDADLTPRTTSEAFRAFVDDHARLMKIRASGSPSETTAKPCSCATFDDGGCRAGWYPDKRYYCVRTGQSLADEGTPEKSAPRVTNVESDGKEYYGQNCPKGKVQVEFVGCGGPANRYSNYGWKPADNGFVEIYVDGERYNVQIGAAHYDKSRRGLHIIGPIDMAIERMASNSVTLWKAEPEKAGGEPK